jgi:hypothetical protein
LRARKTSLPRVNPVIDLNQKGTRAVAAFAMRGDADRRNWRSGKSPLDLLQCNITYPTREKKLPPHRRTYRRSNNILIYLLLFFLWQA